MNGVMQNNTNLRIVIDRVIQNITDIFIFFLDRVIFNIAYFLVILIGLCKILLICLVIMKRDIQNIQHLYNYSELGSTKY